jgi:hypothetical protein
VPVPLVKEPKPARPKASVRRSGRRWFVSLKLGERARTSVLIQRRRASSGKGRRVRFTTVRGIRARSLKAGTRRITLGGLRPARYRVRIRVVGSRKTTIVRAFRVPPKRSTKGASSRVARGG